MEGQRCAATTMSQYNLSQNPGTSNNFLPINQSPLQVWERVYQTDPFIAGRAEDSAIVNLEYAQSGNPIRYGLTDPMIPWSVSVPGNGLASAMVVYADYQPQWMRTKALEVRTKSSAIVINVPDLAHNGTIVMSVGAYDNIANMAKVGGGSGGGGHDRPTDGFLYPVC